MLWQAVALWKSQGLLQSRRFVGPDVSSSFVLAVRQLVRRKFKVYER
jgi:hypothetical protein